MLVCGFMMLHVFERLQTEGASATLCRCSHKVWASVHKSFKHCVQDGTGPVHTVQHTVAYRMFVPEVFSIVHLTVIISHGITSVGGVFPFHFLSCKVQ